MKEQIIESHATDYAFTVNQPLDTTFMVISSYYSYNCTESVPRQEEGRTGKYRHEVEGVPEGAAGVNSRD